MIQDEVFEQLAGKGVPKKLAVALSRRGLPKESQPHEVTLLQVIFFGMGCCAIFFMSDFLAAQTSQAKIVEYLANDRAILFNVTPTVSPLLTTVLMVIVGSLLPPSIYIAFSDRHRNAMFTHLLLQAKPERVKNDFLQGYKNVSTAEKFIRQFGIRSVQFWIVVSICMIALTTAAIYRDLQTFDAYTDAGYIRANFLPWKKNTKLYWADAVSVDTGCRYQARWQKSTIFYRVSFSNGTTVNLGNAKPLENSWMDSIKTIDAALSAANVPFSRTPPKFYNWDWVERDSLHQKCLAAVEKDFGEYDYREFRKLLRMTKQEKLAR